MPNGLNTDFKTLWNLCGDHPDVQALLDEVTRGKDGNPTGKNQHDKERGTVDNIHSSSEGSEDSASKLDRPDGTSRAAGIRKLRKHAPELLDRRWTT